MVGVRDDGPGKNFTRIGRRWSMIWRGRPKTSKQAGCKPKAGTRRKEADVDGALRLWLSASCLLYENVNGGDA